MRSYDVGLSWAEHDLTDGDTPSPGRIPALDELLATLAEAPDLASSAAFLLSRLGELSGSSRGFVRLLDPAMELLAVVASVGLEEGEVPRALSINELSGLLSRGVAQVSARARIAGRTALSVRGMDRAAPAARGRPDWPAADPRRPRHGSDRVQRAPCRPTPR